MVTFNITIHEDADLSDVLATLHRIEKKMTDLDTAETDLTGAIAALSERLAPLSTALADAQAANVTLTDTVASLTSLNEADQAALTQAAADAATSLAKATEIAGKMEGNVTTLNTLAQSAPPPPPPGTPTNVTAAPDLGTTSAAT